MAVDALAVLDRSMNTVLLDIGPHLLMASQTKGIDLFFYKALVLSGVNVVAAATLALTEGEMNIRLIKLLFQLCMAVIT
jgi:hypothetical protein